MLDFNEVVVFHCKTETSAKRLLDYLHEYGFNWRDGQSLLEENFWFKHKETTCYICKIGNYRRYIEYSTSNYYKNDGYEIVDFNIQRTKYLANYHLNNSYV